VVRTLLRPVSLLAPLNGSDQITPAIGGFYIWAFGGSVALPAARYDYNSDWTPLLAGLSPAGMAASLAALERPPPKLRMAKPVFAAIAAGRRVQKNTIPVRERPIGVFTQPGSRSDLGDRGE
jgi:hypothetical protein